MTNNNGIKQADNLSSPPDWSSEATQQLWFSSFKSSDAEGLRFNKFQEFLQATLYKYFESFPCENANIEETCIRIDENSKQNSNLSNQQEMKLFKTFDHKNDHILDFDEFSYMCHEWLDKVYNPTRALVVVDVQNDFIDGSLALINGPAGQDGADVVPVINNLLDSNFFKTVVYTQDWHPIDHIGFHANLHLRKYKLKSEPASDCFDHGSKLNKDQQNGHDSVVSSNEAREPLKYKKMDHKAQVFDIVVFDEGRIEQKLWPTHCVQDSWGAQFHPKLKIVNDAVYIQKGTLSHVDAYSAFWDNMRSNETGLRQELLSRKISDVYFCGLALDYCVAASALDSTKAGFITYVIEDACRGIDNDEINRRKKELRDNGVLIVKSDIITRTLDGSDEGVSMSQGSTVGRNSGSDCLLRIDRNSIRSICYRRAFS